MSPRRTDDGRVVATLSWNQSLAKFKAERRFNGWCIGSRERVFGFNRYVPSIKYSRHNILVFYVIYILIFKLHFYLDVNVKVELWVFKLH